MYAKPHLPYVALAEEDYNDTISRQLHDIRDIDLKKSMKGKDFGQGFYLSADRDQAYNIARIRSLSMRARPIVNIYEIHDDILQDSTLSVKRFNGYTEDWARFVLANRNNQSEIPIHNYDIVIGPIANDRVGQQIRKFTDGEISLEAFIESLKYMKGITSQYFFGTEKAIGYLQKIGIECNIE